ncbi:hypothetical protein [Methylobacterium indicum]|uniref:hypothetical protein n=1 Tax=Methylobacterium indicum TaxID=1775910 RepID=UPI001041D2CC|nr:hypothetical protein [Methylobacterium indicum]
MPVALNVASEAAWAEWVEATRNAVAMLVVWALVNLAAVLFGLVGDIRPYDRHDAPPRLKWSTIGGCGPLITNRRRRNSMS